MAGTADAVGDTASLQGVSYAVRSARIGRDAAVIGLGSRFENGTPIRLFLNCSGGFTGRSDTQSLTGRLTTNG